MSNKKIDIPEIDLTFTSERIVAKTRKLKHKWKYGVTKNYCTMITHSIWIYLFYKIWWAIKPPQNDIYSYCDFDYEKEFKEQLKEFYKCEKCDSTNVDHVVKTGLDQKNNKRYGKFTWRGTWDVFTCNTCGHVKKELRK